MPFRLADGSVTGQFQPVLGILLHEAIGHSMGQYGSVTLAADRRQGESWRSGLVLMEWTHPSITASYVPGCYNHPTIVKQMGSPFH